MASKRQMTAAKLNRERDVKERRARKLARRAERKAEAAERAANPEAAAAADAAAAAENGAGEAGMENPAATGVPPAIGASVDTA